MSTEILTALGILYASSLLMAVAAMWRWPRTLILAIYIALAVASAWSVDRVLGIARPISLEHTPRRAEIAWHYADYGRAIYAVVMTSDGFRFYVLPWTEAGARKLHEGAERRVSMVLRIDPFDPQPKIEYPDPQPAPPLKEGERQRGIGGRE